MRTRRKFISLLQKVVVHFVEYAGTVEKCGGTSQENLHGCNADDAEKSNNKKGGANKTCNFCSVEGHKEARHFKKNLEKAPAW